jgi:hypothetical protein
MSAAVAQHYLGQWRHVEEAARLPDACVQIDWICTHNECTRHDSAAAPNGGSGVRPLQWPMMTLGGDSGTGCPWRHPGRTVDLPGIFAIPPGGRLAEGFGGLLCGAAAWRRRRGDVLPG